MKPLKMQRNVGIEEVVELTGKICFVPFAMKHKDVISIDYKKECPSKLLGSVVNGTATGSGVYYDVFELLLNNNVVPIVEIK